MVIYSNTIKVNYLTINNLLLTTNQYLSQPFFTTYTLFCSVYGALISIGTF